MRCLILCCLAALAACREINYASHLDETRVYNYKYEALVTVGARSELPVSQVKFTSDVKIIGDEDRKFFIQLFSPKFEELNGVQGRDSYVTMTNLNNRISAEFAQPFAFIYNQGHVSHITVPAEVSDTAVNLARGILDIFAVSVKNTSVFWAVEEGSIYGRCMNYYYRERVESALKNIVRFQRVVDLAKCSEKAEMFTGLASAVPSELSKLEGLSHVTKVDYDYKLELQGSRYVVAEVKAIEEQSATPFNLNSGHFFLKAEKKLTLSSSSKKYNSVDCGEMKYAGELMYKFGHIHLDIPVVMQERDQPLERAQKLLQKLTDEKNLHIAKEANEDTLKLIQLYRVMTPCDLNTFWNRNKLNSTRSWLLSTITDTADMKLLNFIIDRFEAVDILPSEASELVLVGLNHIVATKDIVKKARVLLTLAFTKNNPILMKTVALSYGSLVYKLYVDDKSYAFEDIQPLKDILDSHLAVSHYNEENVITALKALANTGSPNIFKYLRKVLFSLYPGRVVTNRIKFSAIEAVRLVGDRDQKQVQEFAFDLFRRKDLHPGLRMLAVKQLLESKPSRVMLRMLSTELRKEVPTEVDIFVYAYLRSLARSTTPENRYISVYCKLMVAQLSRTYHRATSKYNIAARLDWYSENLLAGNAASYFILNAMKGEVPDNIILSSSFFGISRILPLLQMGFDLIKFKEIGKSVDPKSLLSLLERLKSIDNDRVIFSFYTQIFGQEIFYAEVTKEKILDIMKAVKLFFLEGGDFSATRSVMVYEVRHIQPTCVGLPSEISKIYHSISGLKVHAKHAISPLHLPKKTIMATSGSLTLRKHLWTTFGVNTDWFQCTAELKSKVSVYIPWNLTISVVPSHKKIDFMYPIPMAEITVFELRSDVNAVIRTVGTEEKKTEIFPSDEHCHVDCMSTGYGSSICVKSGFGGTLHQFNDITSLFFGSRQMSIRIVPDRQNIGDKVLIEIDVEDGRKVNESIETGVKAAPVFKQETNTTKSNCSAVTWLTAQAVVLHGNHIIKGQRLGLYQMENQPHFALQLSDVVSAIPWMCLEGNVHGEPLDSLGILARFGANCSYSMSLSSSLVPAAGHMPAMKAVLRWYSIPDSLNLLIKRIGVLAPGILYMKDFSVIDQLNAMRQVTLHMYSTVHRIVHMSLEFPKFLAERSFAADQPSYVSAIEEFFRNTTEIRI